MKNIMKYVTLAIGIVVCGIILLFIIIPLLGGVIKVAFLVLILAGIVSFIKRKNRNRKRIYVHQILVLK